MNTTRRTALILSAAVLAITAAAAPAAAHDAGAPPGDGHGSDVNRVVASVRAATAPYHDVSRAIAAGYVPIGGCAQSPEGAMGFHYMNPDLVAPGAPVDPAMPAMLTYGPTASGRLELWSAEFFEPDVGQPHPTLGGIPFDGPMPGHEPGMPTHYDLHVWVGKHNPAGLFAPFNPALSC